MIEKNVIMYILLISRNDSDSELNDIYFNFSQKNSP